jgi:hypothetical protein
MATRLFDIRELAKVYRMQGLTDGQVVVLHPPDTLTDGARVRLRHQ